MVCSGLFKLINYKILEKFVISLFVLLTDEKPLG